MVKKRKMTLLPIGGLANRMRAIASAVHLCRLFGCSLDVYWFRDKGLNAHFDDIFKEIKTDRVCIHGDSLSGKLLYDHPRRHNMWIPLVPQKLIFDVCIYNKQVYAHGRDLEMFKSYVSRGKVYISSCYTIVDFPANLLSELFRPVDEVMVEVKEQISLMSDYRLGVHVRRTDHIVSIKYSPNDLFFKAIDEEISLHPSLTIYLATDSEKVKEEFRHRYGNRLFSSAIAADRTSVSGIKDAVVEMYILSMTDKILGSCGSSYSEIAAILGQIPLIMLKG